MSNPFGIITLIILAVERIGKTEWEREWSNMAN